MLWLACILQAQDLWLCGGDDRKVQRDHISDASRGKGGREMINSVRKEPWHLKKKYRRSLGASGRPPVSNLVTCLENSKVVRDSDSYYVTRGWRLKLMRSQEKTIKSRATKTENGQMMVFFEGILLRSAAD